MNSDIKYYKLIKKTEHMCPLISMEIQDDVTIIGYYHQNHRWHRPALDNGVPGLHVDTSHRYGWSYMSYLTNIASYGNYVEITKEEADRELFLYEL